MPRSSVIVGARPRVALVTGAGRGIGRATAIRLSHEGYAVALTARSADQLEETAAGCGTPTLCLPADIMDAEAVERLFDDVEREWGPVEVLVANAGGATSARVHRITDDDWQRMLDLNLTAPFRCVRRALPAMLDRGWGRVVVVASIAAKLGDPYIAAYTASKHGVLGLVRSAAAEVAGSGVTVNAVCPGYVDTPMTDATTANIAARTGRSEAAARAMLTARMPAGRLVTVDEVSDAILTCVADSTVNGAAVDVLGEG